MRKLMNGLLMLVALTVLQVPVSAQPYDTNTYLAGLYNAYSPWLNVAGDKMWIGGWLTSDDVTNYQNASDKTAVPGPDKIFLSTKSGSTWGTPSLVYQRTGYHVNDPSIVQPTNAGGVDRSAWLYMYYTELSNADAENDCIQGCNKIAVAVSTNGGTAWSHVYTFELTHQFGDGEFSPSALVEGDYIYVYYNDSNGTIWRQRINMNGWDLESQSATNVLNCCNYNPHVVKESGTYYMLTNGISAASFSHINRFTSSTGTSFANGTVMIDADTPVHWIPGPFLQFYAASSPAVGQRIIFGYASNEDENMIDSIQAWDF